LTHLLEYCQRVLGPAESAADSLVATVDWHSVQKVEVVHSKQHSEGHALLRLRGGNTVDIQVGNTHRHEPLAKTIRVGELRDFLRQQSVRPGKSRTLVGKRFWISRAPLGQISITPVVIASGSQDGFSTQWAAARTDKFAAISKAHGVVWACPPGERGTPRRSGRKFPAVVSPNGEKN